MTQTGLVVGGRLTDAISLGVLASWVPRDAVDGAGDGSAHGRGHEKPGTALLAALAKAGPDGGRVA